MDRLARDAAARYGPSSSGGGGGGYSDSLGRRSSRRESRSSSSLFQFSHRDRRERSPDGTVRYNDGIDSLNRIAAERRAEGPRQRRESRPRQEFRPIVSRPLERFYDAPVVRPLEPNRRYGPREPRVRLDSTGPMSAREYDDARRYEEARFGLRPSYNADHSGPARRLSTFESYREERGRARQAERERSEWHHDRLFDASEGNRQAAERFVRENCRTRDDVFGGTRVLGNGEVPERYGGMELLSRHAAERARKSSWHYG